MNTIKLWGETYLVLFYASRRKFSIVLGLLVCLHSLMSFQSFFMQFGLIFWMKRVRYLLPQSVELVEREARLNSSFHDILILVFPMAKAYESFLKKLLFVMGLIDRNQYEVNVSYCRSLTRYYPVIGMVLALWKCVDSCGEGVARVFGILGFMRNHLFHYFPEEKSNLSRKRQRITAIDDTRWRRLFM